MNSRPLNTGASGTGACLVDSTDLVTIYFCVHFGYQTFQSCVCLVSIFRTVVGSTWGLAYSARSAKIEVSISKKKKEKEGGTQCTVPLGCPEYRLALYCCFALFLDVEFAKSSLNGRHTETSS